MAPSGAAAERQRRGRYMTSGAGGIVFRKPVAAHGRMSGRGPQAQRCEEEAEKAVFLRRRFFDDLRKIAFSARARAQKKFAGIGVFLSWRTSAKNGSFLLSHLVGQYHRRW